MRKVFLTTAVLLLALGVALAQQPPATSDSTTNTPANAGSQITVQGCLGGSAGNFTLLGSNGTTYQLQGDDSKLKDHVGHTISVTGTLDQRMLSVSSMQHISDKCSESTTTSQINPSASGAAGTAGVAGSATTESSQASQPSGMASSTSPSQPSDQSSATAAAPSTSTTDQTQSAAPASGMSSQSSSTSTSDQSAAGTSAAPSGQAVAGSSTSDQNQPSSSAGAVSDQSAPAASAAPSTSDQTQPSAAAPSGTEAASSTQAGESEQGKALPQTASPLPLLGLLGLGSLATGLIRRRKK